MQEHTGIQMMNLIHQLFRLHKESFRLNDLTALETRVLYLTYRLGKEGKEHVSVTTLKQLMNVSHPTISQVVSKLQQKGLIRRDKDQSDKRISIIKLTSEGQTKLDLAFKSANKSFVEMSERLGSEKSKQFISILEEMIHYYKEGGQE
jgi:DNA-binding MarR family transcriptional regulator